MEAVKGKTLGELKQAMEQDVDRKNLFDLGSY